MTIARAATYHVSFPMYDSATGALKTGLTPSAIVSLDGGNFGAVSDAPVEIETSGVYEFTLTIAEMTADLVTVKVTAAGALSVTLHITTDDVQARLPAALVGGRMDSSIGAVANGAIAAAAFAAGAFDAIFTRALSAVEASAPGRSLAGAIAKLVNKVVLSGGTLSVKQTDDTTDMFTQTAGTDAAAEPVVSLDTD